MRIDKFSTRNEKLRAAYRLVSICNRENFVMRHEPYLVKDNNGYGKPVFRLYYPNTPDDMMTGIRQFWENMSKLAPDIDPSILKFVPSNENEYYAYAFETNKRTDTPDTCYMIEDGYDEGDNALKIKNMEKKLRNDRKEKAEEMEELSKQAKMKEYEEEIPTRKHYNWTFPTSDFTEKEISDAALKAQKSNESFFIEDDTHMRIFEEFVQNDNSTEAKLRRYLERKRKEAEERDRNRPHPKTREELQDMIVDAIEKNGTEVDLNHIDTSEIEDMNFLFCIHYSNDINKSQILQSFNGDISEWDVSSVEDMRYMFKDATSFNGNISDWDVSNVTNMTFMFYGAASFNGDISDWDVRKVTNMNNMFCGAASFNQDISNWKEKLGSVTDMSFMFDSAESFDQNLSGWDVARKYTVNMFKDCPIEDKNKPKGLE